MSVALTPRAYTAAEARDPGAVSERLRARGVALDPEEVTLLLDLLGRPPSWPEVVLFGILWSEHCSYKSTRHLLRRLPTEAPQVILGPGADAGVVALPAPCDDLALVLAHESHNHPSQVLPVEGAATGVGGIVRDVNCMGAEVVGTLDVLCLGDPYAGVHARDVTRGVVEGIAGYGNPLGVPNLGGATRFHRGFDDNCLVNVMAAGLAPRTGVLDSRVPEGGGPWAMVLVGKPTDESGFGGAAFASESLGDADRRGAVQLPDPFLERVLCVANAEVFARLRAHRIPAGFKDLGAGGVACATSELAAAGGRGAVIALEAVHRVDRPLLPEVVLCAETQERFCWAVPESFADELCDVYNVLFALGDVHPGAAARRIGHVTDDGRYRVTWEGETIVDCAVDAITSGRRVRRPAHRRPPGPPRSAGRATADPQAALLRLLGGFEHGSRAYLYRHYDSEVQGRTWMRPGEGDAGVILAHPERPLGVAFAVGGEPRWCAADPELGARHAVAEAARNVACVGARPWALTDCLNFGPPEDPSVMGDLEAVIEGLSVAAESLGGLAARGRALPFVSGNVSLYNRGGARSIPPTPIVMCAGVVADVTRLVGMGLVAEGDFIVVAGAPRDALTGSAYVSEVLGETGGAPPELDLPHEGRLQEIAVLAAEDGWVRAAHDVAGGGMAVTCAEMLLAADAGLGLELDLGVFETGVAQALFSERPAIVFEVPAERAPRFFQAARERGVLAWPAGRVTRAGAFEARLPGGGAIRWSADALREAAGSALARLWNESL